MAFSISKIKIPSFKIKFPSRFSQSYSTNNDDSVPRLIYMTDPISYLLTKVKMGLLRCSWDPEFREKEFKRGASKAAVQMIDMVRRGEVLTMQQYTTSKGYKQVLGDTIISSKDPRLNLLRFREKDVKKVYPVRLTFAKPQNVPQVYIDVFFALLRPVQNMILTSTNPRILTDLAKIEAEIRAQSDTELPRAHEASRLILAEVFSRFHRDYSKEPEWNIEFFKVSRVKIIFSPIK